MQSSQTAAPSLSRGTVQTERLVTLEDLGVCLESQLTLSLIPGPANHERDMHNKDTCTFALLQKQAHYSESCMYVSLCRLGSM